MSEARDDRHQERQRLVDSIRVAFPVIPVPVSSELVAETPYRDFEREYVKRFLSGRSWDQITLHDLNHVYEGDASAILSFCSDKAFNYYFPSFLILGLTDLENADLKFTSTIYKFTLNSERDKELYGRNMRRIMSFSKPQLEIIRDVFSFVSATEPDELPSWEAEPAIQTIESLLERQVDLTAKEEWSRS